MPAELAQELCSRERSLVAGERGPEGLHERRRPGSRDAEEPFDVAAREQGPVELFELADGVGDGEEPPGRGGHRGAPCRLHPLRRVRGGTMEGAHPVRDVSRWSSNTQAAGGAGGVVHKRELWDGENRRRTQRRPRRPRRAHWAAGARRPRGPGRDRRRRRQPQNHSSLCWLIESSLPLWCSTSTMLDSTAINSAI